MKKGLLIINTVLLASILIYMGCTYKQDKKGYINISTVYNDFDMKKELESKLINVQNHRKKFLDSLEIEIQMLSNKLLPNQNVNQTEKQDFQLLQRKYAQQRDHFAKENERIKQEFRNKIFGQMNKYVEEFGEENEYDYLFGTTGQGSIMFAKSENDVTQEVTNYINEKYKGNS